MARGICCFINRSIPIHFFLPLTKSVFIHSPVGLRSYIGCVGKLVAPAVYYCSAALWPAISLPPVFRSQSHNWPSSRRKSTPSANRLRRHWLRQRKNSKDRQGTRLTLRISSRLR